MPVVAKDQVDALIKTMSRKEYRNILDDLEAFTGFSKTEICERAIKKTQFGFGAKGWFNEEFAYFDPKTPAEYDWFYRAGQIYVFSNARKRYWNMIEDLTKCDQPILDYGAGIGLNVLELYYRGLKEVWFMEIGSLQTEFFEFRMRRHGFEPKIIRPYHGGRFDTCGCLKSAPLFRTILAQDVFEHINGYDRVLAALVDRLESGGKLIEQSPFARRLIDDQNTRGTRMHLVDTVGFEKCIKKLGMGLEKQIKISNKTKVRIWTKN